MDIIEVIENNPVPWTVAKFAAAMGVSVDQVYDLVKSGKLPALLFGGKILLDPARTARALREMLNDKKPAQPEPRMIAVSRKRRVYKRDAAMLTAVQRAKTLQGHHDHATAPTGSPTKPNNNTH